MEKPADLSYEDFSRTRYPTYEDGPCSPDPPADFRGLMIRLPRKVTIPAEGAVTLRPDTPLLPVCGLLRLASAELDALGVESTKAVVLVFVDQETATPTTFNLRPDKPEVEPEERKGLPDEGYLPSDPIVTDSVVTEYFNVDAFMFCPDFPRKSARYHVHALLGKHRSNSVALEVEAK
jgi:hypothetical protein